MGAENSVLEGCQWGEDVLAAGLDWDLQHASTKDGRPITVFQPRKSERKYKDMIQQLAKSLKMLRHPNILRYIGAGKSSEGCFLVTEEVTPLASVLDKLSPLEVCAGLSDVLDALMFLHDKVGITHNNVSIGAVFVAKDGGWRLGELQHACPFSAATADFLDACRAYRDQSALSPEEKQGGVEVKSGQGHARDVFALGVFIEVLSEQLTDLGEFSKTFEEKVGACLSADPAHRPRVLELKNDSLFQNDFIQILNFVRNVALKTPEEKAEFFSGLLPRLLVLPEELVAHRLAVPLLSRFVLLDEAAVTHVVPHLLTPRSDPDSAPSTVSGVTPVLNSDLFKAHVVPELQRIFHVHDAHIRLVLLQHFSSYVHLFEAGVLQNEIFPQILLGLRDTSDAIVASSFRALADLVPLLGGDTVIGGPRKTFFFHGLPKCDMFQFSATKEKEEQPVCVTDVMKHVKSDHSLSLPNGKPLLKDLAAGVASKAVRDPAEQERKMLERERRREEARQRKEERQRKLKQQQLEAENDKQKVESVDADTKNSMGKVSDNISKMDSDPNKGDRNILKIVGKVGDPVESDNENVNEDDRGKSNDGVHLEEEKFAIEESEDEWEDWDESATDSGQKLTDDIISDEIEMELSQMPGSRNQQVGGRKVPTSPDPYLPGTSSAAAEWPSVDPGLGTSAPERLKSGLAGGETDTQTTGDRVTISSDGDRSLSRADSAQVSAKGLKLVARNKTTTASTTKTTQAKKAAAFDDLGLGYDIKSIELTAVKEVDFFADMTPDIKPGPDKSGMVSGTRSEEGATSGDISERHVASGRFAVADATNEESAGWGDDGDWGAEDF